MAKLQFPQPRLKKMIGPSFMNCACAGLRFRRNYRHSYLVANYGLGVAWGAVLGISFQFSLIWKLSVTPN